MAETKTKRTGAPTAATKAAATRRRRAAATSVDRSTELSGEVLQSMEDAQRAAIEAVHKFVDAIDHTLPALPHDEDRSRRQQIIDSALEMADRLVHTQYDYLRKVVDSTGRTLSRLGGEK